MFIQILNELIPAQIGLKYYQTFTQTLCLSVWPGQKLMNRRELVISGWLPLTFHFRCKMTMTMLQALLI